MKSTFAAITVATLFSLSQAHTLVRVCVSKNLKKLHNLIYNNSLYTSMVSTKVPMLVSRPLYELCMNSKSCHQKFTYNDVSYSTSCLEWASPTRQYPIRAKFWIPKLPSQGSHLPGHCLQCPRRYFRSRYPKCRPWRHYHLRMVGIQPLGEY